MRSRNKFSGFEAIGSHFGQRSTVTYYCVGRCSNVRIWFSFVVTKVIQDTLVFAGSENNALTFAINIILTILEALVWRISSRFLVDRYPSVVDVTIFES